MSRPSPRSLVAVRNLISFKMRGCQPTGRPPSWRTIPYRLSACLFNIFAATIASSCKSTVYKYASYDHRNRWYVSVDGLRM